MSTSRTSIWQGVAGDGRTGPILLVCATLSLIGFFALPHVPNVEGFNLWFDKHSDALYVAALTVQVGFLAAILTIWTLLRTRASRYLERLADSEAFKHFLQVFEIRFVIGCVAVGASCVVMVAGWDLTAEQSPINALIVIWAFLTVASGFLLGDSILTAKAIL
jgi:hypothetical protein